MRILIVLPRQPRETGNWVTAERFSAGLVKAGHKVQLTETPVDSPTAILTAVRRFTPDTALLLHAYRSGNPWLLAGVKIPQIVLLTGTDLHRDNINPAKKSVIARLFKQAAAILLQNRQDYIELGQNTALAPKLRFLPTAVSLGDQHLPLNKDGSLLLLHPAGIRPIKGNLELLLMCDMLRAKTPPFRLAFCGPELDAEYAASFHEAVHRRSWAQYLGAIPQSAMASVMRQADIILNNSASEGLSNALTEASTLGRPILARVNSGNRFVVEPGHNGLLYGSEEEFLQHAYRLLTDAQLRAELTDQSTEKFSSDQEAVTLNRIFADLQRSSAIHPVMGSDLGS